MQPAQSIPFDKGRIRIWVGRSMEKLFVRGTVYPIEDYLPLPKKNIADSPLQNRWKVLFRQHFAQIAPVLGTAAVAGLMLFSIWLMMASTFADIDKWALLQHYWVSLLGGSLIVVAIANLAARYLRPVGMFLYTVVASSRPLPFDVAQWQSASYCNDSHTLKDTARVQMVDDLLHQYDFVGSPSTAVFALLGQPTEVSLFSEWDILYFLGPEPGLFSTSHLWLGFQLDDQQRVTNCQVVSD
ncbi:MAG: hypothetical protein ACTS2F_24555 [Thainema sp.]